MRHATHAAIVEQSDVKARAATSRSPPVPVRRWSRSAPAWAPRHGRGGGSVSVLSFDNATSASIGDEAGRRRRQREREGDDHTATTLVAGTIALGIGGGGVGAGVGDADRERHARLDRRGRGRGCPRQGHRRSGRALGRERDETTTAAAACRCRRSRARILFNRLRRRRGRVLPGFAGAVSVATVDSDTAAWIGADARRTGGGDADAAQDVNVGARNELALFNVSGALGVGAAGIAGGGMLSDPTTPPPGSATAPKWAPGDIGVSALANTDIESYVVSAAGDRRARRRRRRIPRAVAGDEAQGRLESGDDDAGSYVDGQATDGSVATLLGSYIGQPHRRGRRSGGGRGVARSPRAAASPRRKPAPCPPVPPPSWARMRTSRRAGTSTRCTHGRRVRCARRRPRHRRDRPRRRRGGRGFRQRHPRLRRPGAPCVPAPPAA